MSSNDGYFVDLKKVTYFLSDQEKLQYKNDGYILRENQFSSAEIDIFREFFETTVSKAHSIAGEGKELSLIHI